jgi:hypothetical protein
MSNNVVAKAVDALLQTSAGAQGLTSIASDVGVQLSQRRGKRMVMLCGPRSCTEEFAQYYTKGDLKQKGEAALSTYSVVTGATTSSIDATTALDHITGSGLRRMKGVSEDSFTLDIMSARDALRSVDLVIAPSVYGSAVTRITWKEQAMQDMQDACKGSRQHLLSKFTEFDLNGDGDIDEEELVQAIESLGLRMTAAQVGELFQLVDLNKDGTVGHITVYLHLYARTLERRTTAHAVLEYRAHPLTNN